MTDVTFTVGSGSDDGAAYQSDGSNFSTTNNQLYFGRAYSPAWHSFFRFDNVTIAPGSTISSAVLRIRSASTRSGSPVNLIIHCEAADDPSAPSDGSDLIGRSLTTGTDWDSVPTFIEGTFYDSVDISNELQEVIV